MSLSMVFLQTQVFIKIFQFLQEKTWCWSQKETPTQMLSCEYCKTFKKSFFYRIPPVDAFGSQRI